MSSDNFNKEINVNTINLNIKKEMNQINQINQTSNEIFNEPKNPLEWKFKDEGTFHFKQDIERLWSIFRNFDLISLIDNKGHYPCILIKGENFWKEGSEFKGCLFDFLKFIGRVEKTINFHDMKKIQYLFDIENKGYFKLTFNLYKVSNDNTTVFDWKIKISDMKIYEQINNKLNYINKINKEICSTIIETLDKETSNLVQYESAIINGKMNDIWGIIINYDKLSTIAPNNECFPSISFENLKVGDSAKIPYKTKDGKIIDLLIKLEVRNDKPCWNKWLIGFSSYSEAQNNMLLNTIMIQLTKISENKHQLSMITKFHVPTPCEIFKELSNRKKYVLYSIKDYFDNFYSPNSNDNC